MRKSLATTFNPILLFMATTEVKAESSNSQPSFLNHSHSRWAYDVFLSFRGDTRRTFTDHLYHSLDKAGVNTFRDEEEVRKGETLSSEFRRAIRSSRISIIVFSKGYASSRWCLDELVEILECKDIREQIVLPIFYDVDPSEMRKQIGEFGEALARHEERYREEKVKIWREAFTRVGELSGWDLQQVANGYETKFIDAIIREVLSIVERVPMFVAKYPVGLVSRIKHIVRLMCNDIGDDVQLIGIYGMGGIGKTTLVKAVYNKVFEYFDSSCFLEIRSSVLGQHNNKIIALQQELLRQLLSKEIKVSNVDQGIMLIKKMLHARKSLIVLDDLEDLDELDALVGERNWFGAGSKVILTTRDKHILKDLKGEECYMVKELNEEDSLQLFSLHTFKLSEPPKDYTKLSKDIVRYCEGLPLALQVLGAHLSDKQKEDWRSALERLKKIPSNKVHEKLKISFDGLPSQFTKDVFLDMACCFPGEIHKNIAISLLEVPGYFPDLEIQDLIHKSLISIDKFDNLRMHSLIREMGRQIVHSESPNNPGEQSRLCCPNDIREVLLNHTGTAKVEGIVLDEYSIQNMSVDTKVFKNMMNLRMLRINNLQLHGSFKYLSRKLRWLQLNYYRSKYIPSDFRSENLVILSIENSSIEEFRAPLKYFPSMKCLSFSGSKHLTRTPNFIGAQLLEWLSFYGCSRLVDVHSSIGDLGKLNVVLFDLCGKLKKLPKSLFGLKSLNTLSVDSCPKLRLPEELGGLTSLNTLYASDFSDITSSSTLYLPTSLTSLCSLSILEIGGRNRVESHIAIGLESLSSLKFLELSGSDFHCLPFNLCQFSRLECIQLDFCNNIEMLPPLPTSLKILRARLCGSLAKLPNLSNLKWLKELDLFGCKKLVEVDGLDNLDSIEEISLMNCNHVKNPFTESFFKRQTELLENLKLKVAFSENEIPSWFSFQEVGSSISFQLPLYKRHDSKLEILVLILWLVWEPTSKYRHYFNSDFTDLLQCQCHNNNGSCMRKPNGATSSTCYLTLDRLASLGMVDKREIEGAKNLKIDLIDVDDAISVKKVGVHALYVTNADFEGDDLLIKTSEKYAYLHIKRHGIGNAGRVFRESLVRYRSYFS
ncbi:TMV resistance protein N-like isoform X2 [Ipomoea triloba]|uniref:TMV resistance protein N-like isoform X2 n=1 Tax=Ipomoea triloba TaxID=35885 RepID=UPI00125DB7FE|nr:TMV resistance protein N-like isoform X2 [Ipomoea triloba]